MAAPQRDGFTLLETLLALLVFGLVLVTLQQGLAIGVRARATQDHLRGAGLEFEPVEHALRDMIGAMDPGTYADPPFIRGTAHSAEFITDLPAGALVAAGRQLALRAQVALLAERGLLLLRWRPNGGAQLFAGSPQPETTVLTDGVAGVTFDYGGRDGRWSPSWSAEELPVLVRMSVTFTPASGRHWPPIVAAPRRERPEE